MSDSLRPRGLQPARLLCPWDSPGKNTGVGCHFLLQGIFPTQGSNPGLLHCRQMLYPLSHHRPISNFVYLCSWSSYSLPCFETSFYQGFPLLHKHLASPIHGLFLFGPEACSRLTSFKKQSKIKQLPLSLHCFLVATSFFFSFWTTCQKGVHSSSLPITAILCRGFSIPVLHGWRRSPGTSRGFTQFHLQLLPTPYFLTPALSCSPLPGQTLFSIFFGFLLPVLTPLMFLTLI